MTSPTAILDELDARGLLHTCNDRPGLCHRLNAGPICGYAGFDPTADSLHVGSLLALAVMRLWTHHGHRVVALVGGATGMIGDPSGKNKERTLLDVKTLEHNRAALTVQIQRLLTVDGKVPPVVDNRDWFESMGLLEFQREIGKLIPVSDMLEALLGQGSSQEEPAAQLQRVQLPGAAGLRLPAPVQDTRLRAAARRQRPVRQHHCRHRPDPPPRVRPRLGARLTTVGQSRRRQVREDRERQRLAQPGAHQPLPVPPVLAEHGRRRRAEAAADVHAAVGR